MSYEIVYKNNVFNCSELSVINISFFKDLLTLSGVSYIGTNMNFFDENFINFMCSNLLISRVYEDITLIRPIYKNDFYKSCYETLVINCNIALVQKLLLKFNKLKLYI